MLRRYNVEILPGKDYKSILQSAYCRYYTTDDEFYRDIEKFDNLKTAIDDLIFSSKEIPEFNKDPYEMEENEIKNLYNQLYEKYVAKNQIEEEKKLPFKTLDDAEKVLSVPFSDDHDENKPLDAVPALQEEPKDEGKVEESKVENEKEESEKEKEKEKEKEVPTKEVKEEKRDELHEEHVPEFNPDAKNDE